MCLAFLLDVEGFCNSSARVANTDPTCCLTVICDNARMDQELVDRISVATKRLFSRSFVVEEYDGDVDLAVERLAPEVGFAGRSQELYALCIMRLEYPKDEEFVLATEHYYGQNPGLKPIGEGNGFLSSTPPK